ncbi:hypothetical protein CQW23_00041 [Capsicum baccatum]|uniref:F-box domain-containing protein n=1 Tax=Capsicum baccatum TaxID=33114 RepID=A0A2G2XJK0_CAPBA|nr:hypothetical protein CQW23_00041 [Capsicum baccatum]
MGEWAELPDDLIAMIANRVKVLEDFIAFSVVCTSWRTVATKENFDAFNSPQAPLLMLPDKDEVTINVYVFGAFIKDWIHSKLNR